MARKRFFIRYNAVSDTVEAFTGKRPKGSKWQELTIDKCCPKVDLCPTNPIPFSLTDPTNGCNFITSSTYATNPDEDPNFQHYIKFVGQDGQGNFIVNIPVKATATPGSYVADDSKTFDIPKSAKGNYKAILYMLTSGDYPSVTIKDSDGNDLSGLLSAGNGPSLPSTAFDIADVASLVFSPNCSG